MLNLFYEEPKADRWLPYDRYPRALLRRLIRGARSPGGQMRVFLNLCAGLDRLGVAYRVNDYRHLRKSPGELACVIGKPHVLDKMDGKNPILFGASGYSHPSDDPELPRRLPVRKVLVPGQWYAAMFKSAWGDLVEAWPVGIDTALWQPAPDDRKKIDVLLYDKVRWHHEAYERTLLGPIRRVLERSGRSVATLRYGYYREEQFLALLGQARTMIFVCEHETQGIAYQQALSCGVPILAWDRGGYWQDPAYYPERVKFAPVTSVPYWDERCGMTFADAAAFARAWPQFWEACRAHAFRPRGYILDNLTLEKAAQNYVRIARALA